MRKKQFIVFLIALTLINVTSISLVLVTVASQSTSVDYGLEPMDLTPEMLGEDEIAIRKKAAEVGSEIATGASPVGDPATIGEVFTVICSDAWLGIDYPQKFVVLLDGVHGIICIEKEAYDAYDTGTDEYVFSNPNGCWRPEDRISTIQLQYLLDEFDNVIYPTDTSIFGEPLPRGEEGQKTWILIFNIRDPSYYDCSYTWYYAGYFSASTSSEQNKNIMHIDSYDWENRIGPGELPHRAYLYEGVFAHEFEHLVHFDQDPDEPSWVDEGLADLAGFFCGYGHADGHIDYYLRRHWYTPLTFWGNNLEDYGASYLFQLYLFEHFGGAAFTSALVQEQANGIEGIENTLVAFGYSDTFDEIFDRWTIANYVDDTRKAEGKYGYYTLEIGGPDTRYHTIEYWMQLYHQLYIDAYGDWLQMWPFYETPFVETHWQFVVYGDPLPYTAQYFRFNSAEEAEVWMDGQDVAGVSPYSGSYEWYSDAIAWAWRSFYQTFDIPAGGATLNFMTFFEIEWNWDYGYVEVYDHNTGEWSTLYDPAVVMYDDYYDPYGMLDFVGHPQDNPNCPDGREPMDYEAAGTWYAFSGYSDGWLSVSMDLGAFADHTIDLYFTTWQDAAFTLQMMYIDDISIPEIGFFDDVEAGEDGWTTTGWYVSEGLYDNGWSTTVFDYKAAKYGNSAMTLHDVWTMIVDPTTQTGTMIVPATPYKSGRLSVAVCANHADHILANYYTMGAN